MFGVVRIALGGWLLLLPKISDWGFSTLSVILFALLLVSGLVGILFAPDTTGRDLEETQGSPRGGSASPAVSRRASRSRRLAESGSPRDRRG